jgi:hypothetical protein
MILTERQLQDLAELPTIVAQALPRAPNPDVPFFVKSAVVRDYEMLRAVWVDSCSIASACQTARSSRTDYYRVERAFLSHGVAGIFPELGIKKQKPRLERLALLVKTTRPKATETMILRFAEALQLDPPPSLRTIGQTLHSHGFGNGRDENDREFWRGLQESIRAIESARLQTGPSRSTSDRKGTFYVGDESLQVRFELLRELGAERTRKVGQVVRRYGLSRPTFYKYVKRFRMYGPWGLVDWMHGRRERTKISAELELRILEEKLEHPRLSLDELMARLELRCSRMALHEILKFWDLLSKSRRAARLRGLWTEQEEKEHPGPTLLRTAKEAAQAGQFQVHTKLNGHFARVARRMMSKPLNICNPGPIILAQFIDDLGVCEALQMYGPRRGEGAEVTNTILLNICRILAGYESVNHLQQNGDRSVAIAAGLGAFPGRTTLYDALADLKFTHLQDLRNDVTARARDLGLVRGKRIAHDFHFKEFYGQDAKGEGIGQGPNSAGTICPGYRPHVIWDLDTDVLINIAFCNGSSRATTIVRRFCETNLYPILGRDAIHEIYMDSEYTSFPVIDYFVVDEFSSVDVTMCLKRNKRVEQLMRMAMADAQWAPFGKQYEITGKVFKLETLAKPLHLVVKRNQQTGDLRCFGTTVPQLSNEEVLERYRLRWPIENGLKDLIKSYFIDNILGKDPEKIETNFYCVQVARLAYENFLTSLDERFVRDSAGHKRTLSTFRHILFARHNCELRRRGDHIELTYLDLGDGELQKALRQLLAARSDRQLNRVSFWGGLGLTVRFQDQYAGLNTSPCTERT